MPVRACLPVAAPPPLPPRARRLAAKRSLRERARLSSPQLQPPPSSPPADADAASAPPFEHHAGVLPHLRLPDLLEELSPLLRRETVVAASGLSVEERRETCWLSDSGSDFCYSGKVMTGGRLTPRVAAARDALAALLPSGTHFDSVLVNHYPSGESAMRFHSDPQGEEWAEETAVVSVGAARRFAFRSRARPSDSSSRTVFTVQNGDVVRMWGVCQSLFQHALLPEPGEADSARISLVFKLSRGAASAPAA